MKKAAKIFGYVILVLVILAFVIRLALPPAAVKIANRTLPGILGTEASIGALRLGLIRGYVSIRNLRIAQPEGFGGGDLLLVPEVSVQVRLSSLFKPPRTVEEVILTDWEVNIVKNAAGVMNLDALQTGSAPPPAPAAGPEEAKESPPKPILVRKFSIRNLSCSYTDHAIGVEEKAAAAETGKVTTPETPPDDAEADVLRVKIAAFNLLLNDLLIDPAADPAEVEPAAALLTARIIQPPFRDGILGLDARIGPVGGGIPAVNAVLRLADLELKPLRTVVPAGTALVLRGSALDLSADLALTSALLDCEIEVEAAGGHRIPLSIGGTPDQPEIDASNILFGVMLHLGGGVGSLVGNIGGTGLQVGSAAAETTLAVGTGAAKMVGSVGKGLFQTVTSAATGDLDGTVKGLSDTTVGTVKEAGKAAGDVAGELAEGATATADSATGQDGDREWRAETPNRWRKSWDAARKALTEMPFPAAARESTNID